uniref:Prominin1Alike [Acyrthosiphon pisum] n=2 Tax=Lepeophtheirus salmonis TaxID=72036 RepID=A0A0K2T7V4_LEPSM
MNSLKMTSSVGYHLLLSSLYLLFISVVGAQEATNDSGKGNMSTEALVAGDRSVLSSYKVIYSEPQIDNSVYSSRNFDYNPKSMEHLYYLTHYFIDLITKDDVIPPSLAESSSKILSQPSFIIDNWKEFLLHYIGVVTLAICGLIAAVIIPIIGFCFCCCRCAGKCGGYPEHFDKKSDACKRVMLGASLSLLIIGSMFCVITTFVTNHYSHQGLTKLPMRLDNVTEDASHYLEHTGLQINSVFVTNYNELEKVLNEIIDQSGVILKKSLAEVTQAVAIDDITSIVNSLGDVKKYLRDIKVQVQFIKDHIGQLSLGLEGTKARLLQALKQCLSIDSCGKFMDSFNIESDLSVVSQFESLNTPAELDIALKDIEILLNDDIQQKVRLGQKQLDSINLSIDASLKGHKPQIRAEIRRMGQMIEEKSVEIQGALNEVNRGIDSVRRDLPSYVSFTMRDIGKNLYYIGLGMSCLVLIILICYILGLFYGFCGKRPGNEYGDDCCNRGSGANWIIAAVYMTFLFSFVLLILATAQFIVGTVYEKSICRTIKTPNDSDVFKNIIDVYAQPELDRELALQFKDQEPPQIGPLSEIISNCHLNKSAYEILNLERVFDVERIKAWRDEFNIAYSLQNINVRTNDLRKIELLSSQAREDLERLAESQISDMNFTAYTELVENSVTQIELPAFIRKLRQVKEKLRPSSLSRVGAALENEALFLDQMQRLIVSIRVSIRQLKSSITAIENEAKYGKINMREALQDLMRRTDKATQYIRSEGPQLIDTLSAQLLNETVSLIDGYANRIVNKTKSSIGKCWPVSEAYNATVLSVCSDIADPFNGFWVSIGLCYVFYLTALAFAVALVSLYRQAEPYPGPLVTVSAISDRNSPYSQQSFTNLADPPKTSNSKKSGPKSRGHRRNPSESLPEAVHYRAAYSYRFQDAAPRVYGGSSPSGGGGNRPDSSSSGPPRYTSNPNLNAPAVVVNNSSINGGRGGSGEYERPPPYYYPGPDPSRS